MKQCIESKRGSGLVAGLLFLLLSTSASTALAQSERAQKDTLIIFTPKTNAVVMHSYAADSKIVPDKQAIQGSKVNTSMISNFISDTRMVFCGNTKNTDVKLWIKYDAEAKIFGVIGGGFENGIEVTYHCK